MNEGAPFSVPTSVYAVKVGHDIRMFLTGRKDWNEFVNAVAKAFAVQIQNEVYSEVMNASLKVTPSADYNKTGTLGSATKDAFDELLENVSIANDSAPVLIMGTKVALKKLNALTDINWRADSQKEAVAHAGILGDYEGTEMMEIPQRLKNNSAVEKLVDSTKLLILPMVDNKFVKFVDYGETTLEVTEAGDTMNDQQTYEVQRRMGIATVITKNFGVWNLQ